MNYLVNVVEVLPSVALPVVKGALLLGIAWLVVKFGRRSSAADRHAVWMVALAAVLLLPVLSWSVPGWKVAIPVSDKQMVDVQQSPVRNSAPVDITAEVPFGHLDEASLPEDITIGEVMTEPQAGLADLEAVTDTAQSMLAGYGSTLSSWIAPLFADWQFMLLAIWILGVMIVAGRWILAYVGASRMVREAVPVEDEAWLERAYELGYELGAPEDVYLFSSDRLAVPVAWCFGRPVIILPGDYREFDDELRDIVLRHELAHIVRRDGWTQVIAQAAVAIHWFNPLVWLAWRRVLVEREQACDDMVLAAGTTPSTYADYLMQISKRFQSPSLALAAVASMARHSDLHTRVTSILDNHRSRHSMRGLPALIVVLLALPLAAFQLGLETVESTIVAHEIVEVTDVELRAEIVYEVEEVQESHATDWTWSGRVSSNGEVEIHSVNGTVSVRQGRGNRVEVSARVRQQRNDGARLEVVERGGSIVVCIMHDGLRNCGPGGPQGSARGNRLSEVDVMVTMPAGVRVRAETVNGSVNIFDHNAAVVVHTVNGQVYVQSSGSINARTTNGAVSLVGGADILASTTNGRLAIHSTARRSGNYSVNASTTNGAITARFDQTGWRNNASFLTSNGRIRIELPTQPNTTVDARSNRGSISSDLPLATQSSRSRNAATGTLGRGGRGLVIETTNGAIEIVSGGRTSSMAPYVYEHTMVAVEASMDTISRDWISDVVETSLAAARVALDNIDLSHLSSEERLAAQRDLEEARRELANVDLSEARADLAMARVEVAQALEELDDLHLIFEDLDFSGMFEHIDEIIRQVERELEILD